MNTALLTDPYIGTNLLVLVMGCAVLRILWAQAQGPVLGRKKYADGSDAS